MIPLADKLKVCGGIGKEDAGDVTIFYNSVSGSNPEKVTGGNGSFTFTVPMGYTEVTICMIGGGGSGACGYYRFVSLSLQIFVHAGGGKAGAVVTQVVSGLVGGQQVTVTIGAGGSAVTATASAGGNAGGDTSFNGIVAAGGVGGLASSTASSAQHTGNGGSGSNCYGTFSDGLRYALSNSYGTAYGYGGQRGFANGGRGNLTTGTAGSNGSGGGAAVTTYPNSHTSGAGGSGVCKISWT